MGKVMSREKRELWRAEAEDRRVSWIVHGKTQSVEFWIQVGVESSLDPHEFRGEPCRVGGFELHSRAGDGEPSQGTCSVLGSACWHDGSSLGASEFFDVWDQSDEATFFEAAKWLRD